MDPKRWIYGFLDGLPGLLRTPLKWVADRIFGILDDGVTFAKWIKSGVAYWSARALGFIATLLVLTVEIGTTAVWVVKTFIPQRISAAISAVKSWASPLIASALNTARGLVSALSNWAVSQINAVTSFITQVRDWLLGKLNALIDKVHHTVDEWYDRLTHPDKFAQWLVGALIGPLWRYVYGKRNAIMSWVFSQSAAATLWLARELENILARLL